MNGNKRFSVLYVVLTPPPRQRNHCAVVLFENTRQIIQYLFSLLLNCVCSDSLGRKLSYAKERLEEMRKVTRVHQIGYLEMRSAQNPKNFGGSQSYRIDFSKFVANLIPNLDIVHLALMKCL